MRDIDLVLEALGNDLDFDPNIGALQPHEPGGPLDQTLQTGCYGEPDLRLDPLD